MSKNITKPRLQDVVADAAADVIREAAAAGPASAGKTLGSARKVAAEVVNDPRIAPALQPVSRFASQTIQGILAAGAQLLEATELVKSLVIAAGWFGATWKLDEVSSVLTTVITLAGLGWAW